MGIDIRVELVGANGSNSLRGLRSTTPKQKYVKNVLGKLSIDKIQRTDQVEIPVVILALRCINPMGRVGPL